MVNDDRRTSIPRGPPSAVEAGQEAHGGLAGPGEARDLVHRGVRALQEVLGAGGTPGSHPDWWESSA